MVPSLAEAVADTLARHGVRRIFGIPGGGSSLALIDAAAEAGIDFVLTRGETAAALMASVTGELSGTPGVVLTGVGPGAASAVNGVAYAFLERAPLIVLTDGPATSLHQAFDQNALFAPITKNRGRLAPATGRVNIARAIETALAWPPGPVQLDMTAGDAEAPVSGDTPAPRTATAEPPDPALLAEAGALLAAARRPAIIAGLEARHGEGPAALARLAEALACPVLPSYKAKGTLPDGHLATVGLFTGAAAEAECLGRADLILLFGFDPVEAIPGRWRYDAPVLALGRAAATADWPAAERVTRLAAPLEALIEALLPDAPAATDWTAEEIAALREALRRRLRLARPGRGVDDIVEALQRAVPPGCRLCVDSGAHMFSAMAAWRAGEPFGVLKSNGLSTMGFALPAAIASALQEPERPVVALTGDGGLMMGLAELAVAAERRLPVTVVVANDAALSLIDIKQQRDQRPSRGVRTAPVDFAAAARALGCRAWRVGKEDDLDAAIAEAVAEGGPVLVDVESDPSGYLEQLAALRG